MRFGTDGIRGVYPSEINETTARSLGFALSAMRPGCVTVVGRDTRSSGESLADALCSAIEYCGGIAIDVGIVPTAGVAYLTSEYSADFGVVVSASHNPREYNGLKVFGRGGFKLSDAEEKRVEALLSSAPVKAHGGRRIRAGGAVRTYAAYIASKAGGCLSGVRVLLDCADGAAGAAAPLAFELAGACATCINTRSDGVSINDGSGALFADRLTEKAKLFDATFAFDGDADRVIALGASGRIVNGDHAVNILAGDMKEKGTLARDSAVGTVMTNSGVEKALAAKGITLVRTAVGDKYVLREMLSEGYKIGGEQAGHVIMSDVLPTGDGIATALALCAVSARKGKSPDELDDAEDMPQFSASVKAQREIVRTDVYMDFIRKFRASRPGCRIVVRASGTEPVIRISAESEDADEAQNAVRELVGFVRRYGEA